MRSVWSKVLNTLISTRSVEKYQCSLNCINLPIHLSRIINIRKFSSSTWLLLGLADLYFYGSIVKIFVQRTYQYRSHGTCDTYVVTLQFAVICCNSSLAQEAIPESSTTCDLYLDSGEGRPAEGGWQLEIVGRHRQTGNFKRWSLNKKTFCANICLLTKTLLKIQRRSPGPCIWDVFGKCKEFQTSFTESTIKYRFGFNFYSVFAY